MTTEIDKSCVICGSTEQRLLYDRARDRAGVLNVVCRRCGMVFISPRPTLEELDAIYSSGQFSRDARGAEKPDEAKVAQSEGNAQRRYETISRFLSDDPQRPGRRAMDIGCGIGSILYLLSKDGWSVEGLEPDPSYADFGKEKYGVDIRPLMFEDYPGQPGSLDLIMSFHVLEHVLIPEDFVKRAAEFLKPGGRLYLEVPCIERPFEGNLDYFFWSVHVNTFSANTLTALLERVGFVDVQLDYHDNFLWVVCRRPEILSPRELSYPLDFPDEIYRRTHKAHKAYKLKISRPNLVYRTVRKLFNHPDDVIPAIKRRIAKFQSRSK